jgi:hypothetical protein
LISDIAEREIERWETEEEIRETRGKERRDCPFTVES